MPVFAFWSRVSFSADTPLTYKDHMRRRESYGMPYRLSLQTKLINAVRSLIQTRSAVLASGTCSQTIGWNQPMHSNLGSSRKESGTGGRRQAAPRSARAWRARPGA